MTQDSKIKIGHAALVSWGEHVIKDMTSGIGYPSATAEGRARRDGIGRTNMPARAIVPRMSWWGEQDRCVHVAVSAMPADLRTIARKVYVDALLNAERTKNNHPREHYSKLRECRLWVAAWIEARNFGDST